MKSREDDYRSQHIELYIKEVFSDLLPNARFAEASSFGPPKNIHKHTKLELGLSNRDLFKSQYYFNGEPKFIHYTNLQSLVSIINDKQIRLYDTSYLNDPQEFIFSANKLNFRALGDTEWRKHEVFNFSMCKYHENSSPDNFDLWRLYGLDGNGLGIVFRFENENRKDWFNYSLSKVYYGEDSKEYLRLKDLKKRDDDFHQKYDFQVSNTPEIIVKLLGFHKNSIWKNENEVRFSHYTKMDRYSDEHKNVTVFKTINKQYQKSYYHVVDLFTEKWKKELLEGFKNDKRLQKKWYNIHPRIFIDKVIIGYKYSDSQFVDIAIEIDKISRDRLGYGFPIERSSLSKYFK
jgi:hypothetical protein